jgi:trimeric autotransporter adhesin
MADLTGQLIANSYRNLLQAPGTNGGIGSGQSVTVEDGAGVPSGLALSTNGVGLSGNITIQGSLFTGTGAQLNTAVANAGTLVNGIVAQNGAQSFGRTLVGTAGVTITNANGGAGNPTFALENTSVAAGAYGPMSNITVNAQGRITDITAATTISANAFVGGKFYGSTLYVENDVTVSGSMYLANALNVGGATSIKSTLHVDGATSISNDLNIAGTFTAAGPAIVKNITTSVVSASYLYGDGSNITGLSGAGTMTALTAGTGIHIIENGTTVTGITGSGTVVINANQSFGTVSATSFIIGGDNVAMSATVASLSATMATSISNSNTLIAATSAALATSIGNSNTNITTNTNAITSINAVLGDGSGFATDAELAALSATMATSIGNSNTLIAATSAALATSIGTVDSRITALSATLATSIGTVDSRITALSATLATSIGTVDSRITALSATLATSIGNQMPKSGGTFTGSVSHGDNVIAQFGASNDLQIYHDGLSSRIVDGGTGNLLIQADELIIRNAAGNETKADFNSNGAVNLYYDNAAKLATTNTGVDVTGTVTADGLELNGSNNALLAMRTTGDTDSQVMGTQYLNNSGAVTAQTFATGNSTSSSIFRIKAIGAIDLIGGDIGVTGAAPDLRIDSSGIATVGGTSGSARLNAVAQNWPENAIGVYSANIASQTNFAGIGFFNQDTDAAVGNVADIYTNPTGTLSLTASGNPAIQLKYGSAGISGGTSALTVESSGLITFNNAAGSTETASKTGSVTADLTTYQNFVWTLTGNITLSNPSTEVVGMSGVFIFIHSGAARTVSLGTDWKTAGAAGLTLSSTTGAVDMVPYFVQSSGNILLGTPILAFS